MRNLRITMFFISLLFIGCGNSHKDQLPSLCFPIESISNVKKVSIKDKNMIGRLQGEYVEIRGYFHYNFEDVSICPSKYAKEKESLTIEFTDSVLMNRSELNKLNGLKVIVRGKINLLKKGHFNAYIGSLDSTYCIIGD